MLNTRFSVVEDSSITELCSHLVVLDFSSTHMWPYGVIDTISQYETAFGRLVAGKASMINDTKVSHWYVPSTATFLSETYILKANSSLAYINLPNCSIFGESAFSGYRGTIKSISAGLVEILPRTFLDTYFASVNFPNCIQVDEFCLQGARIYSYSMPKLKIIKQNAFAHNSTLTLIDFPEVTYLGDGAFFNCPNVSTIRLPKLQSYDGGNHFCYGHPSYVTIGLSSIPTPDKFWGNMTKSSFISCEFPNLLIASAFSKWTNLQQITIPQATLISNYCFTSDYSLQAIDIPNVSYIGAQAFSNCFSLSQVTNADKVTSIDLGRGVFYRCSALTEISFPNCEMLGEATFFGCESLTKVYAPKVSGLLSTEVFGACHHLVDVILGAVSTCGERAFQHCLSLYEISIPTCTSVGPSCFNDCPLLANIYLPNLTYVAVSGFEDINTSASLYMNNFVSYNSMFGSMETEDINIWTTPTAFESYITDSDWITNFHGYVYSYT